MNNGKINDFPPNINPLVWAWIAALVSTALVGDLSAMEQNSFGNWLMLVGQFMLVSAAQQQLLENRIEGSNINSREAKNGGSVYEGSSKSNINQRAEVDFLLEQVRKLQKELESLKNKDI